MQGVRTRGWAAMVCALLSVTVHAAAPESFTKLGDEVVSQVRSRFYEVKKAEAWATKHQGYGAAATSAEDFARRTREVLAELGASHTAFYPSGSEGHAALSAIFQEFLGLSRVEHTSIGADVVQTPEGFFVRHVFAGGPAARAGLLRGDRLLSVEDQPFRPVVSFEGRAGQPTRLAVERTRGAAPLTLTVTPGTVNPKVEWLDAQRASTRIVELGGRLVAYQYLYSCAGPEHQDLLQESLTSRLARAEALVIDFRDGWGGCNQEFMNLFNPMVPYFTHIVRGGRRTTTETTWRKPVVLLVNGNSRSGKEVVAFTLKKHGRARLVGQRTAGAVLAGAPIPLSSGDLLYLAAAGVEVDGVPLEGRGVPVDVEVPDRLPYAAGKDPQLDKALETAAAAVRRR